MTKSVLLCIAAGLAWVGSMGVILFGCAGRLDLPMYWSYLGLWAAPSIVTPLVIDPTLLKERIRPGPGGKDYASLFVLTPVWLAQHAVAALDVGRFHWSDRVPPAAQLAGLAATAAALGIVAWAMAVNRFFSSVVRIQTDRGHHLVTSGPYRYVRHPAYAAFPLLSVGTGLSLGSWLAVAIGVLLVPAIVRRAAMEDQVLQEKLEGYADYAQKVRYRLLPGMW